MAQRVTNAAKHAKPPVAIYQWKNFRVCPNNLIADTSSRGRQNHSVSAMSAPGVRARLGRRRALGDESLPAREGDFTERMAAEVLPPAQTQIGNPFSGSRSRSLIALATVSRGICPVFASA